MDNIVIDTSRQAHLAMPVVRGYAPTCAPASTGQVSVFGADVMGDVRLDTADVRTAPGHSAWSPPI